MAEVDCLRWGKDDCLKRGTCTGEAGAQHTDECDTGATQRDESDAGAQKCGICTGNAALKALFSIFKINIKSFKGMPE